MICNLQVVFVCCTVRSSFDTPPSQAWRVHATQRCLSDQELPWGNTHVSLYMWSSTLCKRVNWNHGYCLCGNAWWFPSMFWAILREKSKPWNWLYSGCISTCCHTQCWDVILKQLCSCSRLASGDLSIYRRRQSVCSCWCLLGQLKKQYFSMSSAQLWVNK